MNKLQDYVVAWEAQALGEKSLADAVSGVFIGTKKYFFFIPSVVIEVEHHGRRHSQTKFTYSYKGRPIAEFLGEYVKSRGLSVSEFEAFMCKDFVEELPYTRICPIDEIEQFKVFASWWNSGIVTNDSKRKVGWKSFSTRFKAAKKEIRSFYVGHPKLSN